MYLHCFLYIFKLSNCAADERKTSSQGVLKFSSKDSYGLSNVFLRRPTLFVFHDHSFGMILQVLQHLLGSLTRLDEDEGSRCSAVL